MKIQLLLAVLFGLFCGLLMANTAPSVITPNEAGQAKENGVGQLTIEITNIRAMKGRVNIAVFNSSEAWLKKSVYSVRLPINDKSCGESSCTWQVDKAEYADYGIAVFHDINANGEMDTNFVGLPEEDYGFSNNETSAFGLPPSWKKAKFIVNGAINTHSIALN